MEVRYSGLIAMTVNQGDTLRWVKWTDGDRAIVMASANGQSILFHENEVRAMGRQAAGVMGMRLADDDEVAGMDVVREEHTQVLVITRNGYGKRTPLEKYRSQARFGQGVRTLKRDARTGPVIAVRCITEGDDIMFISKHGLILISKNGKVLRTQLSEVRETGRNTLGVKLMNLSDDDEIAGVAIMRPEEAEALDALTGDGEPDPSQSNGSDAPD